MVPGQCLFFATTLPSLIAQQSFFFRQVAIALLSWKPTAFLVSRLLRRLFSMIMRRTVGDG